MRCFNPHTRGGCDHLGRALFHLGVVSIHAPAGGATAKQRAVLLTTNEFQSTRPQGARQGRKPAARRRNGFNPRARRGRDSSTYLIPNSYTVSIHAPAGGATRAEWAQTVHISGFNPRARRGRDTLPHRPQPQRSRFNPRARRGRDLTPAQVKNWLVSFNPRARRGRDGFSLRPGSRSESFNPRARRGRDTTPHGWVWWFPWFQSTRPQGARHRLPPGYPRCGSFNPRARRGRDGMATPHRSPSACFNPRARRGRD